MKKEPKGNYPVAVVEWVDSLGGTGWEPTENYK